MINIKQTFNFAFNYPIMEYNDKQIQIIEAAEKLFADKGFKGTSVRDIADEADINVAMISYYFGSKEQLMEAIFAVRIGSIQIRIENLIKDESLSPFEKINMLVDDHIERVAKKECFIKIMLIEPYFDLKTPNSVAQQTGAKVLVMLPSVGGEKTVTDYFKLFDYDINLLLNAFKSVQ